MLVIVETFLRIALRRLGPEDLPDSGFLLGLAVLAYLGCNFLAALPVIGAGPVLLRALAADFALLVGCVWLLLRLSGHGGRFRRTLTALLGTGALLQACALPFNWWLGAAAGQPALAPTVGIIAVLLWSLVVNGHILARALSVPYAVGLSVSIAYFIINYLVSAQAGPAGA